MKKTINLLFVISLLMCTSCERSGETWENVKTAGRYLQKGIDSLWGKDRDSYLVQNEESFIGPEDEDFIPLNDQDLKKSALKTDQSIPQPKDPFVSGIPGFHNFKTPSHLSSIFKRMHFETDDHIIREKEDLLTVQKIANYMKRHPKLYLYVAGHTDERASAAYNMALGTRRANHIRVLLIKQGVDFNKIYTVSFGKEKPIALGHTKDDWKINRRVDFKIFEKK